MRWTAGGQPDHASFAGVYGGGGKGGGGGSAPAPPAPIVLTDPVNGKTFVQYDNTPANVRAMQSQFPFMTGVPQTGMSAQDQLNAEITQRQADEKATSDTAAAQKKTDAATAESTFQTNRQSAYDNAMKDVMHQFQLQGVDPSQYMDTDITPALQKQFRSVQDLDPNPEAAFTPDLATSILNNLTTGKRTQASNQLNSIFTPTYSQTALPDTLTDQYLNTILGEQFDPLSSQLSIAQKRGTLSDTGYQSALDALNQKRSAATTTVKNLGQNILASDRSGIDDYISGARKDVAGLNLSTNFDPNTYASTAQGKVQSDIGAFGGALRNAVGDTKFATFQDLLNAGGVVQGNQNPDVTNPVGAGGVIPDDPTANVKRGLGSTGAF